MSTANASKLLPSTQADLALIANATANTVTEARGFKRPVDALVVEVPTGDFTATDLGYPSSTVLTSPGTGTWGGAKPGPATGTHTFGQ